MAVRVAEGTFGGCTNVGEDQGRSCLGGYSLQIYAVPGWGGGSENAGLWAKFGVGVVTNAKAITWGSQQKLRNGRGGGEPLCGLLKSRRRRESKDWVRIEWVGSRISFESRISSEPL
jgi:hypothetical protein